jgi:hypothetical protein
LTAGISTQTDLDNAATTERAGRWRVPQWVCDERAATPTPSDGLITVTCNLLTVGAGGTIT